jgi:hypothetical protein
MSEFNDLMLDGVICQCCGQLLGDAAGYPRSCAGCEKLDSRKYTELNGPESHAPESAIVPEELEDDDLPF